MKKVLKQFLIVAALALMGGWELRTQAQTNGVLVEVYTGISGSTIADLLSAPSFPDRPAYTTNFTNYLEAPINLLDNYGMRVRGFVAPPSTGDYTFWISSDDQSVLYLSPDTNPKNKQLIANVAGWTSSREWDKEVSQVSQPIHLEGDKLYYLEILMKEGGGGDNLAVRWQLPDGAMEEPMPVARLIPASVVIDPPTIVTQPANVEALEAGAAVFQVEVSNLDKLAYQWLRNGVPIARATNAAYTNLMVSLADQGVQYSCAITNILGATNSARAQLSVIPDQTPPTIFSVQNTGARTVQVVFSEPVQLANGLDGFQLDKGVVVTNAVEGAETKVIILATATPLATHTTYTLTVNGITDRAAAANRIAPNSTKTFITSDFSPQDIGKPALPGLFQPVADGYRITAGGLDIGGNADQFQFSYQQRAGNFDIRVRVESLSLSDPWAKAGLMVRESLEASSRFASVLATPGPNGCFFESRATNGAAATLQGSCPVNYPATWLRLKREGSQFDGYASLDGAAWIALGSVQMALTNAVYFGLAASGHSPLLTTVAEFRELSNAGTNATVGRLPLNYEPLSASSKRTSLVVSEIMYNPAARNDGRQLEFIEFYNAGLATLDLGNYRLAGAVEFLFPAGTAIPVGGFLVVAKSPADVRTVYGITNVLGGYANQLGNRSDSLRVYHSVGGLLLEIKYGSRSPWPVAADGAGHSLVLARPSYGENHPSAWDISSRVGGSPGKPDAYAPEALDSLLINEILAHTDPPEQDFIELYNHSNLPVDASGCGLSDDPAQVKYALPAGTTIAARGFLHLTESQLGFSLRSTGEGIFLWNKARTRVLDAIHFGAQARGTAFGRYPDGAPVFSELQAKTPGAPNKPVLIRELVINEIMYHPITGQTRDEYVELYNRGTNALDLSHWRFTDGISFTFPDGTLIPGRGYLVVARDAAHLRGSYTNLNGTNLVGDFTGTLSDRGEHLTLARPEWDLVTNSIGTITSNRVYVAVDEVAFGDGGRWTKWSDGDGSSLELVDAHSDNNLAANWADSDDTAKAQWTTIETTGLLDHGDSSFGIDNIQILLLGKGECLVDDVQVLDPSGFNYVVNPSFEGGLNGWQMRGTHRASDFESTSGYSSKRSLHVRASARGDTGPNQIQGALVTSLKPGMVTTIKARVKWLRGSPHILFRLQGNYLEAAGAMNLPAGPGTPGLANSQAKPNLGPAIYDVAHYPVLPAANEPVRVTARVQDPDGILSVVLKYRFDPSVTLASLNMADDGSGGDEVAGDGVYTATLPGQISGAMVAFQIQATDRAAVRLTSSFPASTNLSCLVRFGESVMPGGLATYRFWITSATQTEWESRERGSNEALDGTFVYGNYRVMYNVGVLYGGSPFHWGSYDSPVGNNCYYNVIFPTDDRFLGVTDFGLNPPGNVGSDSTAQREQLFYKMAQELGLPDAHRRYIHMFVNGVRRSSSSWPFEDVQQPNGEYIAEWFPQDADGDLYKIEDWFEYDPNYSFSNFDATLEKFTTGGGLLKQARYRWCWRKRAVKDSPNNYTNLLQLVQAVNTMGDSYEPSVLSLVKVDEWMRVMAMRHAVGDWDSYGYRRGKNMFAYKPQNDLWHLLNWDISFCYGLGDGTSSDLFSVTHFDGSVDPITDQMFKHPPFRRAYLRAFEDILNGPFQDSHFTSYLDEKYNNLRANGLAVSSPAPIKSFVSGRRDYIQRVLATNAANFAITSNGGQDFRTNRNLITLAGSAPIGVATIRVNGVAYPVSWTSLTNWVMRLALPAGDNRLLVQGYNSAGAALAGAQSTIQVSFSGSLERPEDYLVINEIMYHPDIPDAGYVEIHNTSINQAFDLSRCVLAGLDYAFADGALIPAQGYVLVVRNRRVFDAVYGAGLPVVGEYQGVLQNNGETLSLVKLGATPDQDKLLSQVTYDSRLPWPQAADGHGPSLQLIDPYQDSQRLGNWTAVATNGILPPRWKFVSVTGVASSSRLEFYLDGAGDVFLDDVVLVEGVVPRLGSNLAAGGDFEAPLPAAWEVSTNYAESRISTIAYAGSGSLHLAADATVTNRNDGVGVMISPALNAGARYTLSYWYLPGSSDVRLTVKLANDGLVSSHGVGPDRIATRTPGRVNSVRATLPEFPALWLNEVMPVNTGIIVDATSQPAPWVEVYNGGSQAASLAGYYLSDNFANLNRWPFPDSAVIHPGQYLLVWLDAQPGKTTAAELHAGFTPIPESGQLYLSRQQLNQPAVIDYLFYGGLAPGQSYGSHPDGQASHRQIFTTATPGASNLATPVLVFINEWMSNNTRTLADPADGSFEDWFELYNAGAAPVDLSGYYLTDDTGNATQFKIPNGRIIPARGTLLVWADGQARQNEGDRDLHVNFKLNQTGDQIALYSPGLSLIDLVAFGALPADVSQGRHPDGQPGQSYVLYTDPTPGQPNVPVAVPPRFTGAVLASGTITLTFQTVPGKTYQVQYIDSLADGAWHNLGDPLVATSRETSQADGSVAAPQRYYRVVVAGP